MMDTVVPGRAIHHPETNLLLDLQYDRESFFYATYAEEERDNLKLLHYLIEGDEVSEIDWTPYSVIHPWELQLWIALGKPTRQGTRPLDYDALLRLVAQARFHDQVVEVPGRGTIE